MIKDPYSRKHTGFYTELQLAYTYTPAGYLLSVYTVFTKVTLLLHGCNNYTESWRVTILKMYLTSSLGLV